MTRQMILRRFEYYTSINHLEMLFPNEADITFNGSLSKIVCIPLPFHIDMKKSISIFNIKT